MTPATAESLTSAATDAVAARPVPLTASFRGHAGGAPRRGRVHGSAGVHPAGMAGQTAMAGSPAASAAPVGTPGRGGGGALMMGGGGPTSGAAGDGRRRRAGFLQMGLGGGDLLTGSDFAMNRESRGGILSFWSRGAQSHFSGREGALSLGGDVRTTMFGADYAKGPVVTGLSLSNSRGLGESATLHSLAIGQVVLRPQERQHDRSGRASPAGTPARPRR